MRDLPALGGGRFGAGASHLTGDTTEALSLADLDGDGILDVATASAVSGGLNIHYGDGTGDFGDPFHGRSARYQLWPGIQTPAVVDMNYDGLPDLVLANSVPDPRQISSAPNLATVTVLLNHTCGN